MTARLSEAQRAYRAACAASAKASAVRRDLPPGSSRAKVTTANARWSSAAEERERIGATLTLDERAAVDAMYAAEGGR